VFLTSALDGGEWSTSRPDRFTAGERVPGTHWVDGKMSLTQRHGFMNHRIIKWFHMLI